MRPLVLGVLLFFVFYPDPLGIDDNIKIILQIVSIFLIFNASEGLLGRIPKVMRVIGILCSYTYVFFLIHHVIIDYMTLQVVGRPYGNLDILRLFIYEFLVISALTFIIKNLIDLPKLIKKKRIGQK